MTNSAQFNHGIGGPTDILVEVREVTGQNSSPPLPAAWTKEARGEWHDTLGEGRRVSAPISYSARAYINSHGAPPKGRDGRWAFAIDANPLTIRDGILNGDPALFYASGSFTRAKLAALLEAARRGARTVEVLP